MYGYRLIVAAFLLCLLCGSLCAIGSPSQPHAIMTEDDFIFYPARHIADTFGASLQVDKGTGNIIIGSNKKRLIFKAGSKEIEVDGVKSKLIVPPFLRDGVTYLQARLLIEFLGLRYSVDNATDTNTLYGVNDGKAIIKTLRVVRDVEPQRGQDAFSKFEEARLKIYAISHSRLFANPPWEMDEAFSIQTISTDMLAIEQFVKEIAVAIQAGSIDDARGAISLLGSCVEDCEMRTCDSERLSDTNYLYVHGLASLERASERFEKYLKYRDKGIYQDGVDAFVEGAVSFIAIPDALEEAKNKFP